MQKMCIAIFSVIMGICKRIFNLVIQTFFRVIYLRFQVFIFGNLTYLFYSFFHLNFITSLWKLIIIDIAFVSVAFSLKVKEKYKQM